MEVGLTGKQEAGDLLPSRKAVLAYNKGSRQGATPLEVHMEVTAELEGARLPSGWEISHSDAGALPTLSVPANADLDALEAVAVLLHIKCKGSSWTEEVPVVPYDIPIAAVDLQHLNEEGSLLQAEEEIAVVGWDLRRVLRPTARSVEQAVMPRTEWSIHPQPEWYTCINFDSQNGEISYEPGFFWSCAAEHQPQVCSFNVCGLCCAHTSQFTLTASNRTSSVKVSVELAVQEPRPMHEFRTRPWGCLRDPLVLPLAMLPGGLSLGLFQCLIMPDCCSKVFMWFHNTFFFTGFFCMVPGLSCQYQHMLNEQFGTDQCYENRFLACLHCMPWGMPWQVREVLYRMKIGDTDRIPGSGGQGSSEGYLTGMA